MTATAVAPLRAVPEPVGALPLHKHRIHGYDRAYRIAGEGPPVLLLHGVGDNSETWLDVMADLSRDHLVIAPDMLGHGGSDKPRADYSVGGFANGVRDLLSVLDVDRVTMVGHSMGGGVAMQFAYQYPERCERLVLVAPGGVSRAVHPMMRLATLPFAGNVMAALRVPTVRSQVRLGLQLLERVNAGLGLDAADVLRVLDSLPTHAARKAFVRTLRAVVDHRGQVVTMIDRCYLAAGLPVLLVWGSRDAIVPPHHARIAHAAMPGSRLEVFEGAGHYPYRSHLPQFMDLLREFLDTSEPPDWSIDRWRMLLRNGRADAAVRELG